MNAPVRPPFAAHPAAIPMPPSLSQQETPEAERLYRKQRLAGAFRLFARWGYHHGNAGHITARDPISPDCFWVNPMGVHFSRITTSHLMLVSHDGAIVEAPSACEARLNVAAFTIHSALHQARPDVVAAAHTHSLFGKAFSALSRLLEPITQDAAAFFEDHTLFTGFTGPVHDSSEGERIAQALGPHKAVILENHGILTVGQSVEACVWRYYAMDNACQTELIARAAGTPTVMSREAALTTRELLGGEAHNFRALKSYWDVIAEEEPDLFD